MREKGQGLVFFVSIIFLEVLFGIGCFSLGAYWSSAGFYNYDPDDVKVEKINAVDGELNTIESNVNNCNSRVESKTSDARTFEIKKTIILEGEGVLNAGLKDIISASVKKNFESQYQSVDNIQKTFDFVSPPGLISVHTVIWRYRYQQGSVEVSGKKYNFSFPFEIKVEQRSEQKPCN